MNVTATGRLPASRSERVSAATQNLPGDAGTWRGAGRAVGAGELDRLTVALRIALAARRHRGVDAPRNLTAVDLAHRAADLIVGAHRRRSIGARAAVASEVCGALGAESAEPAADDSASVAKRTGHRTGPKDVALVRSALFAVETIGARHAERTGLTRVVRVVLQAPLVDSGGRAASGQALRGGADEARRARAILASALAFSGSFTFSALTFSGRGVRTAQHRREQRREQEGDRNDAHTSW